jgi:hypothetical protein
MRAVGRDLKGDAGPLDAKNFPAFGEQSGDESRTSSDMPAENPRKNLGLALVGALVDEDAGNSPSLSCP